MKRASRKSSTAAAGAPPADRIQKVLAEAGFGSRREIERWIAEGRISVDGRRVSLGDRISGTERVLINGRPVRLKRQTSAHRHLAYYKPSGEVTTRDDPEDRPTVFERLPLPPHGRWINIGRLDMNTSGLLLLTTDGELAHRLMHPRYEISREYAVRLLGAPSEAQLRALTDGVVLDDGPAHFDAIEPRGGSGRNSWLHVTLREGRNREVRRMFEAVGLVVSRLIRVRYGPVQLGRLQRGRVRDLTTSEAVALCEAVGLTKEPESASPSATKRTVRPRQRPRYPTSGDAEPQSSSKPKPPGPNSASKPFGPISKPQPRGQSSKPTPRGPNSKPKPRGPNSKAEGESRSSGEGKGKRRSSGEGMREPRSSSNAKRKPRSSSEGKGKPHSSSEGTSQPRPTKRRPGSSPPRRRRQP